MFRDKTNTSIRELVESKGTDGAVEVIEASIKADKLQPDDFSFLEMWEQCQKADGQSTNIKESLTGNSFPKLTGALVNAAIIKGYDLTPTIGDLLVDTVKATSERETYTGLTGVESPMEVGEGQEYSDSSISEKFVTVDHIKFGRIISLTEEMIYFDKTSQVMRKAKQIGKAAALYREKIIVQGVQDQGHLSNGDAAYVYNPTSVPTTLYSTTNQNLVSSCAFNEAGLTKMRNAVQVITGDGIDANYIHINMNNMTLLVPIDLEVQAWELANSVMTPESAENALSFWKGRFNVLSSPYVTAESTTTWYAGNPKDQFIWSEVWPLQTFTQKAGNDDSFKKDIKLRYKTRFYGNVATLDTLYFMKMTA